MRAIKIDVEKKEVYEININGSLDSMKEAIGCKYVTHIALVHREEFMWLDDEGLLNDDPIGAFELQGYPQLLSGNALVLGIDPGGNNTDSKFALDRIKQVVSWKDKADLPKASIQVFTL